MENFEKVIVMNHLGGLRRSCKAPLVKGNFRLRGLGAVGGRIGRPSKVLEWQGDWEQVLVGG